MLVYMRGYKGGFKVEFVGEGRLVALHAPAALVSSVKAAWPRGPMAEER